MHFLCWILNCYLLHSLVCVCVCLFGKKYVKYGSLSILRNFISSIIFFLSFSIFLFTWFPYEEMYNMWHKWLVKKSPLNVYRRHSIYKVENTIAIQTKKTPISVYNIIDIVGFGLLFINMYVYCIWSKC